MVRRARLRYYIGPMEAVRLVQIDSSGHPAEPVEALPEVAREVCAVSAYLYETAGFIPPWVGYLAIVDGQCVGTCAFKAPPEKGRVEIAYFTFPGFEGRGIASTMVSGLLELAQRPGAGVDVVAQTLPEPNAANAILRKHGFRFVGTVNHPQDGLVWEWQRPADPPLVREAAVRPESDRSL